MKTIKDILIVITFIAVITIVNGCNKNTDDSFSTVTDIEGNVYKTVQIGKQVWMAQNLVTIKYNDNSAIPFVTDSAAWIKMTTPAYCWYGNDVANKNTFGTIYNWYTVKTGKLCPTGWHAPTDADFDTLELYLGVPPAQINLWGWAGTDQGAKLKSNTGWVSGGNGTNASGFSALPGGYRQGTLGTFNGLGILTYFWSATDDAINGKPGVAWYRRLDGADNRIYKATTDKTGGKYVRCVKN